MSGSYPRIFHIGHKAVASIFSEPVLIQEKVDGSQISFGVYDPVNPASPVTMAARELRVRSKGAELQIEAPDKMFARAVDEIKAVASLLHPGWTYRGEYLAKPKHNVLAYDRVPVKHIALFDIETATPQEFLAGYMVFDEANRLGFEAVPTLHYGPYDAGAQGLRELLARESFLGGQKIEGVVVKNYTRFDPQTNDVLMAKFVSEAFKEVHGGEWRKEHPTPVDVVDQVAALYRTPARWAKAVQHLREAGAITDSPHDIGPLMREVATDVFDECAEEIKERLFKMASKRVRRGLTVGLPEWYKERLLERQFEDEYRAAPEGELA